MKVVEIILFVFLVFAAIYNFDFYELNQWLVSIILLLSASALLIKEKKTNASIRKISLVLVLFLVVKVMFFD